MKIKHMPYGMHDGEDCGFGRMPVAPLAGESVQVCVRLEKGAGEPVLNWRVNGQKQPPIAAVITRRPQDDRLYAAFVLDTPGQPAAVDYRVRAGAEETPWFHFDTLETRDVDLALPKQPTEISLRWAQGTLFAQAPAAACQGGDAAGDEPIFCGVKRFTSGQMDLLPRLSLRRDRDHHIRETVVQFRLQGVHVFGMGERFDGVDQQNTALTLRVEEYFGVQENHSYLPVPMLFTEKGVGLYVENAGTVRVRCDRRGDGTLVTIRQEALTADTLFRVHVLRGRPVEMLGQYYALSGLPALPPRWALGIWMSANGWNSQRETMHQLEMCRQYDLPATALVLEAWSDEKTFYLWNDAQYEMQGGEKRYTLADLRFPADGKWPDPAGMIAAFKQDGIQTVLWQIPVIKRAWEGSIPQLDADEKYAIEKGYCVRQADGTPYRISDGWFCGSLLLDFSNEEACEWWFGKRRYLLDMGVAGFKTDGGEFLFDREAVLKNGPQGAGVHNTYPLQYTAAYHRFAGVTFSRAGYAGAQRTPIHWAGDQWSTWQSLRAQVSAGLSAGLSGIPFWSFDLGGFAGPLPGAELYLRALAVAAFCPVMQWHSEPRDGQYDFTARSTALNDRSPWNMARQTGDDRILSCYRTLAKLRMRLMDYIYAEARVAVEMSRPLMAHLIVDFPEDENVWSMEDAYMFGRSLLIAPVIEEGAEERLVYLPQGKWQEMFTGTWYPGGAWTRCRCPVGKALVFARNDQEKMRCIFQEA